MIPESNPKADQNQADVYKVQHVAEYFESENVSELENELTTPSQTKWSTIYV